MSINLIEKLFISFAYGEEVLRREGAQKVANVKTTSFAWAENVEDFFLSRTLT
jgi:hypothetical protein